MAEWEQEQRKAAVDRIARTGTNTDPEAWLADQLAQLPALPDVSVMVRDGWGMTPDSAEFAAVQKLAHEYGEMCAARALGRDVLIPGCPVEVQVSDERLGGIETFRGEVTDERNARFQLIVKVR